RRLVYQNKSDSQLQKEEIYPKNGTVGFTQRAVLNGKVYPEGVGRNKKEAKQNAAKNALERLMEYSTEESAEAPTAPVHQPSITQSNYVGWLNEYCHKNKVDIKAVELTKAGLHNTFFYSFVVGDEEYQAVSGKTKQDAKEAAAKLVYDTICGSKTTETQCQLSIDQSSCKQFTSEYDPMECLGSGGFGWVYKARNKLLKKDYAVKIVRWEAKSLQEVGALSDLHHLNIVRYYTFWMEDSGYNSSHASDSAGCEHKWYTKFPYKSKYLYIQMELCEGTLTAWIHKKNDQSLQDSKRREESLNIAQQIVTGVEYIHSMKHIHRDLKPDNILFGTDGKAKIGDFGLVTRDDDGALMDRTVNKGTPTYMAPEQEEKNYGRKVDIFPLGLIYFELLWKVSSYHERGEVIFNNFSQKLIIKSMLCKKPEDRPEASTLKAELEKLAQTFIALRMPQKNVTV
uniref:Eukaryotic translation initiation factor 2-alpha kinase 2 n=1 Tax=Sparus aurata TaxID=8175 RepID=A0A671VJB0_SPAAU